MMRKNLFVESLSIVFFLTKRSLQVWAFVLFVQIIDNWSKNNNINLGLFVCSGIFSIVFRLTWGRKATWTNSKWFLRHFVDQPAEPSPVYFYKEFKSLTGFRWSSRSMTMKRIINDGEKLTIESGSLPGCCPDNWEMEVTVSWLFSCDTNSKSELYKRIEFCDKWDE